MRLYADYQTPIVEALAVLEDSCIDHFPVDLKQIQQQYKNLFSIRSYGSFMKSEGLSLSDCIRFFGSEDGAVVSQGGRYIIYYNEHKRKQRIRFTIAHEMGHIFLDHHHEYGEPILDREGIGQQLYRRLENEASCFARNLLCPAYHTERLLDAHGISRVSAGKDGWVRTRNTPLTNNLSMLFYADTLIEQAFNVSTLAAETRVALLNADINKYSKYQIDWKSTSHIKQTAAWYCSHCGLERYEDSVYCPECGHDHFSYQVKIAPYRYRYVEISDKQQFATCPICGNEEFSEDAQFCKICGTPLSNICTHDPTHLNHPEAKFCSICGKPTAFHKTEHYLTIKQRTVEIHEGDFTMKYESDITYDKKTYKIKECPRCNNEVFGDAAQYCKICGLELVNICIPDSWNDPFGIKSETEPHENPPDARFCEQCGAPTVYYQKHELLKSYEEVRGLPFKKPKIARKKVVGGSAFDEDIPF